LALKDGTVIAWGNNRYGESTVPPEAQSGVSAIAAGTYHSLALKDGTVIAWGDNQYGESIVPPEAQSGVSAIAAGEGFSLALKGGRVLAWGYNAEGEINLPPDVQSGVTAIATTAVHSLALKDGRVIAWGFDYGHGLSTVVPKAAQSGVTAISAGYDYNLALKNGKVIAWGYNDSGNTIVPVDAKSGVTAIAAGWVHGLALGNPGPAVGIARQRVTEPDGVGARRIMRFNILLSIPSTKAVSVAWRTAEATAQAGRDYLAASGTLRFLPGETARTIPVTVLGDNLIEPTESFLVKIDHADGATIAGGATAGDSPAGVARGVIRDSN
jgi:alpha-tubulin suppressor-like RCC1 family protein